MHYSNSIWCVRMGTTGFLSVEIEAMRYLFRPKGQNIGVPEAESAQARLKRRPSSSEEHAHAMSATGPEEEEKPPFKYNPLHDMESAWWCSVWLFFIKVDPQFQYDPPVEDPMARQWEDKADYAHAWFYKYPPNARRLALLAGDESIEKAVRNSLPRSLKRPALLTLVDLQALLLKWYIQAEMDGETIDEQAFDGVLEDQFLEAFSAAQQTKYVATELVKPPTIEDIDPPAGYTPTDWMSTNDVRRAAKISSAAPAVPSDDALTVDTPAVDACAVTSGPAMVSNPVSMTSSSRLPPTGVPGLSSHPSNSLVTPDAPSGRKRKSCDAETVTTATERPAPKQANRYVSSSSYDRER